MSMSYNMRKEEQLRCFKELQSILNEKKSVDKKQINKSVKKLARVLEEYLLINFNWENILRQARQLNGKQLEYFVERIAELALELDED